MAQHASLNLVEVIVVPQNHIETTKPENHNRLYFVAAICKNPLDKHLARIAIVSSEM